MSAPQRFSLWRWSRRKLEAKAAPRVPASASAVAPAAAAAPAAAPELPPVESLTFESDFVAFLRPEVDERLKRAALKQLFRDPRFNIMDGLDTYIDDYTRTDPIAPDVCADLLRRGFGGLPQPASAEAAAGGAAPRAQAEATAKLPAATATSGEPAASPEPGAAAAPAQPCAAEAEGSPAHQGQAAGDKRTDAQ